jgi:hypothetical protein
VDDEVEHDEGYVSREHEEDRRIQQQQPDELGNTATVPVDLLPVVTPTAPESRRRADSIDVEDTLTLERARE